MIGQLKDNNRRDPFIFFRSFEDLDDCFGFEELDVIDIAPERKECSLESFFKAEDKFSSIDSDEIHEEVEESDDNSEQEEIIR